MTLEELKPGDLLRSDDASILVLHVEPCRRISHDDIRPDKRGSAMRRLKYEMFHTIELSYLITWSNGEIETSKSRIGRHENIEFWWMDSRCLVRDGEVVWESAFL